MPVTRELFTAVGRIGETVHQAPGKGWPDSVRYRPGCSGADPDSTDPAGAAGVLADVLFEVSDAFEHAYAREFGDHPQRWTFFQLAEHGVRPRELCLICFPIATRTAYARWHAHVSIDGLPEHLEKMIEPPPGTPMTADTCPIGSCRRLSTHVLFFYDPDDEQWTKQLICFPHGATWELGEGLWTRENRVAALLPRQIDEQ